MTKTIKIKKEFTFRELMEYIIQNDVIGRFESSNRRSVVINDDGIFKFDDYHYGDVETYEVEVEKEITENTYLDHLIEVTKGDLIHTYQHDVTINEVLDEDSKIFYTLINGELVKIWQRGEENV